MRYAVDTTTMKKANAGQKRASHQSLPYSSVHMEELIAMLEVLTKPAMTHLPLDDIFTIVLNRLREIMAADNLAILLLTEDQKSLTIRAVLGLEEEVASTVCIPVGCGFAGRIVAQNAPLIVQDPAHSDILTSILHEQLRSLLGVPLFVQGNTMGVLHVGTKRAYPFTDQHVAFFQRIAHCLSQAIEYSVADKTPPHLYVEREEKMQGSSIISMISHEFRTALTGIQGFSELLLSEECSDSEVKDFATDISLEAQRLNRMITDMLDLERMKSGRMLLCLESIDLNAILEKMVDRTRMTDILHPIALELDAALPLCEADPDKITQVVMNLLSNAIKYSPAGGAILVKSILDGQMAHVIIQDSGIGMAPDMLEEIFIPYSRVESESTHGIRGTGLGLPIVRLIVEMHGGRAWAESADGQGSHFHFLLPL